MVSETYALPTRTTAIDGARRWASEHARQAQVSADAIFELELAMTEALSNVIRHAYGGDEGQRVDLRLLIDEHRVELSLRDRGVPFDTAAYVPPDLDAPGAGGYGVRLIAELVDEVHRDTPPDGGNVLRLVKYRKE